MGGAGEYATGGDGGEVRGGNSECRIKIGVEGVFLRGGYFRGDCEGDVRSPRPRHRGPGSFAFEGFELGGVEGVNRFSNVVLPVGIENAIKDDRINGA